jgi:hypothetical protein
MNAERGTRNAELTEATKSAGAAGQRGAAWRVPRSAFVIAALALYLLWLGRGELGWLPGGPWLALAGWGAVTALLLVVWLWRVGHLVRWWAALRARPSGALLIAILLVATIPRLAPMPDSTPTPTALTAEHDALGAAHRMLTTGQFRPATFARPSALLYLQTATGAVAFLLGVSADRWHDVAAVQPTDLATPAHLLNTLLGLLTIALVYATGRRLYNPRTGLLAAALLALSPLAWRAAHVADESALAALAAVLALWGSVECGHGWRNAQMNSVPANVASTSRCLAAAFLLGLATGIRPALLLLTAPLALALWWRGRLRIATAGLLLAASGAGFLVAAPYALAALPALLDAGAAAARDYDLRVAPGTLALFVRHLPAGTLLFSRAEPLLALLGGCGALVALLRHQRGDLLVLAALVPGLLFMLLHHTLDAWQFMPYTPYLALLGGLALDEGWTHFATRQRGTTGRKPRARKQRPTT